MYFSVLVWTLRPGKTYDDFVRAWYPDQRTGLPATAHVGLSIANKREVAVIARHDVEMSRKELAEALLHASADDAERNRRIAGVVETMTPGSMYEIRDTFDLTSDEAFRSGRPT
jgi:hypothetical protein